MKKSFKMLTFLIVAVIFFQSAKAQNNISAANESTNVSKTNLSFNYNKRFISLKDKYFENFSLDGNNFFGLSIREKLFFNSKYALISEGNIQFGNINGETALFVSLLPKFAAGNDIFHAYFGAGPCILAIDNISTAGGFGITSSLGFNVAIYKGLGLEFSFNFDSFSKVNYNCFLLGINYNY